MSDYQLMIEIEERLKHTRSRARDEQFRRDALAAKRHCNHLNLTWFKHRLQRMRLPKIMLARLVNVAD